MRIPERDGHLGRGPPVGIEQNAAHSVERYGREADLQALQIAARRDHKGRGQFAGDHAREIGKRPGTRLLGIRIAIGRFPAGGRARPDDGALVLRKDQQGEFALGIGDHAVERSYAGVFHAGAFHRLSAAIRHPAGNAAETGHVAVEAHGRARRHPDCTAVVEDAVVGRGKLRAIGSVRHIFEAVMPHVVGEGVVDRDAALHERHLRAGHGPAGDAVADGSFHRLRGGRGGEEQNGQKACHAGSTHSVTRACNSMQVGGSGFAGSDGDGGHLAGIGGRHGEPIAEEARRPWIVGAAVKASRS